MSDRAEHDVGLDRLQKVLTALTVNYTSDDLMGTIARFMRDPESVTTILLAATVHAKRLQSAVGAAVLDYLQPELLGLMEQAYEKWLLTHFPLSYQAKEDKRWFLRTTATSELGDWLWSKAEEALGRQLVKGRRWAWDEELCIYGRAPERGTKARSQYDMLKRREKKLKDRTPKND